MCGSKGDSVGIYTTDSNSCLSVKDSHVTATSNDSTLPKARDQDQGYIASDFLDGVKKEFYLKDRTLSGQTKAQSRIQRDLVPLDFFGCPAWAESHG